MLLDKDYVEVSLGRGTGIDGPAPKRKRNLWLFALLPVTLCFLWAVFGEDTHSKTIRTLVSPDGESTLELSLRSNWAGEFVDFRLYDSWNGKRHFIYSAPKPFCAEVIWESESKIHIVGPAPNRRLKRVAIPLPPRPGSSDLSRAMRIEHQLY